jgi:hypothetical protein
VILLYVASLYLLADILCVLIKICAKEAAETELAEAVKAKEAAETELRYRQYRHWMEERNALIQNSMPCGMTWKLTRTRW